MRTLAEVRDGPIDGLSLGDVRASRSLVRELQVRLAEMGLLDPPADGDVGPVTLWAWQAFCALRETADASRLSAALARDLLSSSADGLLPLMATGTTLADRCARSMVKLGYWVARHPGCVNIAYIEGHDLDGQRNANQTDLYNDIRLVFSVHEGAPKLLGAWTATSQPGWRAILNPLPSIKDAVKAAAQITLGQQKAWCVGTHNGSTSHEGLVQRDKVRIHRDRDRNGKRDGDPVFERPDYGINQHHGSNSKKIGGYSAGCLVANNKAGHEEFMRIVKQDARYKASNSYKYMTAIIGSEQLSD